MDLSFRVNLSITEVLLSAVVLTILRFGVCRRRGMMDRDHGEYGSSEDSVLHF